MFMGIGTERGKTNVSAQSDTRKQTVDSLVTPL